MSEAKAKLKSGGKRFSKFSLVGISNAAIDIGVLNLFLWLAPTREVTLLVLYNGVALILANLNSYAWNTLWTFRSRAEHDMRQIVLFGLSGGLIPCPAAITVLLICLQLKEIPLGVFLVLAFSVA